MSLSKLELENLRQNLEKALMDLKKCQGSGYSSLVGESNNLKYQELLKKELADVNRLLYALSEDGNASTDETK